MVQKAVRSEASSLKSLGPKQDWPEVRGEVHRPRTLLSWLLAKWVVGGESENAGRRTLLSYGPENPEEQEIALSLKKWVPLAHETQDSPPGPPPGEGAALFCFVEETKERRWRQINKRKDNKHIDPN